MTEQNEHYIYVKKLNAFGKYLLTKGDKENARLVSSIIKRIRATVEKTNAANLGPNKTKTKKQKLNEINEQIDAINNVAENEKDMVTLIATNPPVAVESPTISQEDAMTEMDKMMALIEEKAKLETVEPEKRVSKEKTVQKEKTIRRE